ncbi:MAG TPA: TetR-like C-terminal domain-containing protein, partial [Acidimicrobiales bacterium]
TSIPRSDDPLEDLRESGRRYRALALAHPMIYRVMFLRVIPGFEPSDEAKAVAASALESLAALAQPAMDAGVMGMREPLEAAQLIWASVHGAMSLELLEIGPCDPANNASAFSEVCSTVLRGLAP